VVREGDMPLDVDTFLAGLDSPNHSEASRRDWVRLFLRDMTRAVREGELDVAWAEAEAACEAVATGAGGPKVQRWAYNVPDPYVALFRGTKAYGTTPTTALRELVRLLPLTRQPEGQ
jgi:hypothetical protein